jgi:predicted transcriptional regulator of viral defense system
MADVLDRQEGVITHGQAIDAGLTRHAIEARLDSRRWQRLYRGVYATYSGPIPRAAMLWGAILRVGDSAVLSHHTAAETWKLSDRALSSIHVSVPRRAGKVDVPGLVVHYSSRLPQARHPARLPPQTTIEDTVLDLSALATTAEDAAAWAIKACQRRLTTAERVRNAMTLRHRTRWRRDIADALTEVREGVHSPLELRYKRNVESKHLLPRGERQVLAIRGSQRRYHDVRYAEYGVCVELDGVTAHPQESRRRDAKRDNDNTLEGLLTLRYDWIPIAYHSCSVALEVGQLLRNRGWPGTVSPCGPVCPAPGYWRSGRQH